jgi:diguanylate cyclase (GGDEF)-like protein
MARRSTLTENHPHDDELDRATVIGGPAAFEERPRRTSESPRHVLIRLDGPEVGRVFRLEPDKEFRIGRRRDCELNLNYEGISRRHARIVATGGIFVLEDLGSANGTQVRGRAVSSHRLQDGDVIQLGPSVSLRYSVTDEQEERMLCQLYQSAVRDPLTGAYNREYLMEHLRAEVSFATRHGTKVALVMVDVDRFKLVNDTYGHQAGDAVLIDLVDQIQRTLRADDLLARYGGEEFAIGVRETNVQGAARMAERVRAAVEANVKVRAHDVAVTISLGCADLDECEEKTPDALIALADRRLYAAKHHGRNRVSWTD